MKEKSPIKVLVLNTKVKHSNFFSKSISVKNMSILIFFFFREVHISEMFRSISNFSNIV